MRKSVAQIRTRGTEGTYKSVDRAQVRHLLEAGCSVQEVAFALNTTPRMVRRSVKRK